MRSNFEFLKEIEPHILYRIAHLAETYLYTDPNGCLMKLRQFAEVMVNEVFQIEHIVLPYDNNQANRISVLKREGIIEHQLGRILNELRQRGNEAVHAGFDSLTSAKTLLQMAYHLAQWYALSYGEGTGGHTFVMPQEEDIPNAAELQAEKEAQDQQIKALTEQLLELQKQQSYWEAAQTKEFIKAQKERARRTQQYTKNLQLSEAETRQLIDAQLCEAGWQADTEHLRYSKGTRPEKGKNLAIAEWPTDKGFADYALFFGLQLVGIVEAKAKHKDISSILSNQCKDYATHIKKEHACYLIGQWGDYQVPFLFATNGRKYLKQLDTKAGIWFLDVRDSGNISKALQGWKSPQGLLEDLALDIAKATQDLAKTPYDPLRDPNGLNLHPYQIRAVEATEKALANGHRSVLLSMATGTGKTRTLLAMIYRFLAAKRFKRILFLVDRNVLGRQAFRDFEKLKVKDLFSLNNIYHINKLEDKILEEGMELKISTVQGLVRRIIYREGEPLLTPSDFDLVIIDEAHRGYILDQEMDDNELTFRNQNDFISKYTTVVNYFDAVKIAVTATPALHTRSLFGDPIFEYTYPEAVIDGHLVDYNPPYEIITHNSSKGIHYGKGEVIQIMDIENNEHIDFCTLEDEMNFEVEHFNRKVIVESFNRSVLELVAQRIDPTDEVKTLIFAVDDAHADLIVKILKEIYAARGIGDSFVQKITGSIGDSKRIESAIKNFRNEQEPNIAVTVDLLTTGVDIPKIGNLVFLRRVKSRILYEQMMGRATRPCPEIGKESFNVYDAVKMFRKIQKVTEMLPVVCNPNTNIEDIFTAIELATDKNTLQHYLRQLIARLQRSVKGIHEKAAKDFCTRTEGVTPKDFVETLKNTSLEAIRESVRKNRENILELLFALRKNNYKYISDRPDMVKEVNQIYGKEGSHPEDYITEFRKYIAENKDKLTALNILYTQPRSFTHSDLRRLRIDLEKAGYPLRQLNEAWNDIQKVDMTLDIISAVRTLALGNNPIDYKKRLENAFAKLNENHDFDAIERKILKNIEKMLLQEQFIEKEDFNKGAFQNEGGYHALQKKFRTPLDTIIEELREYLFEIA
ncbi:MAG: type I restriction-modification system endonuclease [Capnocytophaga gingivalis]